MQIFFESNQGLRYFVQTRDKYAVNEIIFVEKLYQTVCEFKNAHLKTRNQRHPILFPKEIIGKVLKY